MDWCIFNLLLSYASQNIFFWYKNTKYTIFNYEVTLFYSKDVLQATSASKPVAGDSKAIEKHYCDAVVNFLLRIACQVSSVISLTKLPLTSIVVTFFQLLYDKAVVE